MLITNAALSLLFTHLIVGFNARLYSRGSGRNWVLLKDTDTSNGITRPSLSPQETTQLQSVDPSSQVHTQSTVPSINHVDPATQAQSINPPGQVSSAAPPPVPPPTDQSASTNSSTSPNPPPTNQPSTGTVAQPGQNTTSSCRSSSGKLTTFVNQECLDSARMIATTGASYYQCGNCVLGLYDAEKKKPFKPSGPFNVTLLQDQTLQLLAQCAGNQHSKRDTTTPSADNSTVNVELLMGYNATTKACPSGP